MSKPILSMERSGQWRASNLEFADKLGRALKGELPMYDLSQDVADLIVRRFRQEQAASKAGKPERLNTQTPNDKARAKRRAEKTARRRERHRT